MIGFGLAGFLLLLIVVPLLAALLLWGARQRRLAALRFAGNGLTRLTSGPDGSIKRRLKAVLLLTVVALFVLAIARPQLGAQHVVLPREGSDVVLALDVSRSMGVADVKPSRLDAAKQAATALLDHLGGDRVGLVVFAGSADLRFPLTTDFTAARTVVNAVTIKDSGVQAGTGIAEALTTSSNVFTGDQTRGKVIVLISDGEDLSGGDLNAATIAASKGIVINTIGVGTAQGGTVPAITAFAASTQKIIDPATGAPAISHRDDSHLRQLAAAGHGNAYEGNNADFAFDLSTQIDRLEKTRFQSGETDIPIERFQIPLALALALLVLDSLISEAALIPRRQRGTGADVASTNGSGGFGARRVVPLRSPASLSSAHTEPRFGSPVEGRDRGPVRASLFVLALLGALVVACGKPSIAAETLNRQANQHFKAGDFAGAVDLYLRAQVMRPDLPALSYNAGNALSRQGDAQRAIEQEQQAAASNDPDLQDRAFYSIGNDEVQSNQLAAAIDAYKSALRANPNDKDAKYNLEVVERQLAQQQAQQQPASGGPVASAPPNGQQGQPGQNTQGPGQPGQAAQAGQPDQSGQSVPGQGQPGQGQQGQATQATQGGQSGPGQPGQGSSSGSAIGYTGTPEGSGDAVPPDLKQALGQFDNSQSVDNALQALDILRQQERDQQAAQGNTAQQPGQRDW